MSTYVIGDLQGCFAPFKRLLQHIQFDEVHDRLWFTGDLVNRGKQSLDVLRFIKALGPKHTTVLGNHDLHLLAVAYGVANKLASDTFADVLAASDCDELMLWLREQPLLHVDDALGYVMSHTGIAPVWSIAKAQTLAHEVEAMLRGEEAPHYLQHVYGNQPNAWHDDLSGYDRLRAITNYLTRMRYCYADGSLELIFKGRLRDKPEDVMPWFAVPNRIAKDDKIIFGHWASLGGDAKTKNVYALDTGCVWGNCLTAMRLEDEKRFSISCA